MPAITVTGVLERVDIKVEKPFDPYCDRYGGEHHDCFLDCALRGDDGIVVYFKSARATRNIASGGCYAVVCYFFDGSSGDWLEEQGGQRVASPGKSNDNVLVAKVKVGDRITIRGTLKTETTSKRGNVYRVMNRVKLVKG